MTTSVNSSLPPPPREPPSWARRKTSFFFYLIDCGLMILACIVITLQLTRETIDTVIALFFCLFMAIVFLFLAWRDHDRRRLLAIGEVVRGVVKDIFKSKGGVTIIYEYSVEGQSNIIGKFGTGGRRIKRIFGASVHKGDEVIIIVDPHRPLKSTLWGKA